MLRGASFFIGALVWLAAVSTSAQTTLFNIPVADTLQKGSWGLEGDFITKPARYSDGGYQTYGYRVAYGLGNRTELGSNFYYTWDGEESAAQAEFSWKQNVYRNEKLGLTVSGGTVAFVPLRARNGNETAVLVYGVANKTINALNGMTLIGGVYHVFGGGRDFGDRSGSLVGISQPIIKRVSFVGDWFSGKNRLGYASAGLNFGITKRQYLTTGWSFGNSGRGNNSFAAYYGVTF
ncbi:MAG: hypothetical protein IPM59_11435 [Chloracidobacterium sp.]|nr:hypothetical protein [Chloracidobacterium sp.]